MTGNQRVNRVFTVVVEAHIAAESDLWANTIVQSIFGNPPAEYVEAVKGVHIIATEAAR